MTDVSVINPIPLSLQHILLQLNIVAAIERNQKLNMGSRSFTDSTSWIGALFRLLGGESRKLTLSHLQSLIGQAIDAIREYNDTEFQKIIVNSLSKASVGINNLIATYHADPSTVAALNLILENIKLQINKHVQLLDGHTVPSSH